jgi:hypothetical protein
MCVPAPPLVGPPIRPEGAELASLRALRRRLQRRGHRRSRSLRPAWSRLRNRASARAPRPRLLLADDDTPEGEGCEDRDQLPATRRWLLRVAVPHALGRCGLLFRRLGQDARTELTYRCNHAGGPNRMESGRRHRHAQPPRRTKASGARSARPRRGGSPPLRNFMGFSID